MTTNNEEQLRKYDILLNEKNLHIKVLREELFKKNMIIKDQDKTIKEQGETIKEQGETINGRTEGIKKRKKYCEALEAIIKSYQQ